MTTTPIKPIIKGLITFLPGVRRFTNRGSGGTGSARYCYSTWLRHCIMLHRAGAKNIRVLAELGPGDSLGTGIAARLSGIERYIGLEVKRYFNTETNLAMLDALVELFRRREPIPGPDEFPGIRPDLESYDFPDDLIPRDNISPERIKQIRSDLARLDDPDSSIVYAAPWDHADVMQEGAADVAISQAVMEHVGDIRATYQALNKWLRPGGYMSHTIDFRCHKTANHWNGHWGCADLTWRMIVGSRSFLINREPHSAHIAALKDYGLEILQDDRTTNPPGLQRNDLAVRFRGLTDQDLETSTCYIVAQKPKQAL